MIITESVKCLHLVHIRAYVYHVKQWIMLQFDCSNTNIIDRVNIALTITTVAHTLNL